MAALPWIKRQEIEPAREYVAMASRLPLMHHRSIPWFLRDTLRIRRQLASTPGLIGYALDAHVLDKTFWTFSVWTDRASLAAFARADPHLHITRRLEGRMGASRFEYFPIAGHDVPLPWDEVRQHLTGAPR